MRQSGRRFFAEFGRGYRSELRHLLLRPRFQVMLALLLVTGFLSMEVYHEQVIGGLPLAVIDLDNSSVSRTLRIMVDATREIVVVDPSPASLDEAERQLFAGRISGYLYIPAAFSVELKKGRKPSVMMVVDMSNILIGKNAYKALSRTVTMVAAGAQLTMVRKLGARKEQAMAKVAPIAVDETYNFNPATNYAVYLVPALLFFLLNVYVLIAAATWVLPHNRPATNKELAGGFGAIFTVGMVLGLVMLYVMLPLEDMRPQSGLPLVLAHLACLMLLNILMAYNLALVVPSPIMAFEVTLVIAWLSMMLSGVTYPTDAFPWLMKVWAELIGFTPFARSLQLFLHHSLRLNEMGALFFHYAWQAALYCIIGGTGYGLRKLIAGLIRKSSKAADHA